MKNKSLYLVVTVLVLVSFLAGAQIVKASEPKTLLVGHSGALSGPGAIWGVGMDNGARLAIEDINSKGGITIKGQRFNFAIKSYDMEFKPDKNLEMMHRLVESDKADILWTMGASSTVACLPYFGEAKKLVMHCATGKKMMTHPTGSYYCFKVLDDPPATTSIAMKYFREKFPNVKKIYDMGPDSESGWESSGYIQEYGKKYGIEVKTEYYPRGISDFYPIITRGLDWKPDMITTSKSDPASISNIIKQARELGFKGLIYSDTPYAFDAIKQAAGAKNIEGWMFTNCSYLVPGHDRPEEREFRMKYIKKHGEPFLDNAFATAQGIYFAARAMEKAQSLEIEKLFKVMETSKFTILGRNMTFVGGSKGSIYPYRRQSNTGIIMVHIKNGEQVALSQVMYLPDDF